MLTIKNHTQQIALAPSFHDDGSKNDKSKKENAAADAINIIGTNIIDKTNSINLMTLPRICIRISD